MITDRRLLGAALGLALAVAACGGSSSSPSSSPAASQEPAASQAPASEPPPSEPPTVSEAPASEAAASSAPQLSLAPGSASDLEAMLPSTVNGVTFQKTSIDGSQIAGAGTPLDASKVDPLLSKFGKSIADVRLAYATGGTSTSGMPEMVYAIQIKGVPAAQWANEIDSTFTSGDTMTLGGKKVVGTSQGGFTTAYYTKDDVLFMIIAPDKDADAIASALP
jgi:hypothetical protein